MASTAGTSTPADCLAPLLRWLLSFGRCRRLAVALDASTLGDLLIELVRRAEMEKAGIRDPFREHRKRPLCEHLIDWEASLRAVGRGDEYLKLKLARARVYQTACGPGFRTAEDAALHSRDAARPRGRSRGLLIATAGTHTGPGSAGSDWDGRHWLALCLRFLAITDGDD